MEDYFKYLTHNSLDEDWGLYLTVAGCARVPPGTSYPPPGHPTGYSFNWENGRILHEFQINYVTEGEGILELKSDRFQVKEGSVIIIRPDQWHRYRPLKEKGWKEHIVKCTEEDSLVARGFFGPMRFLKNSVTMKLVDETIKGASELYKGTPCSSTMEILDLEIGGMRHLFKGEIDEAPLLGGQVAGRIHEIPTVKELIEKIMQEAEEIIKNMSKYIVA